MAGSTLALGHTKSDQELTSLLNHNMDQENNRNIGGEMWVWIGVFDSFEY
jgi:hypothetical protein